MFDWIDVLFDLAFEGIATLFDFRGRRVEKRAKAANSYLLKNYEETIKPKKESHDSPEESEINHQEKVADERSESEPKYKFSQRFPTWEKEYQIKQNEKISDGKQKQEIKSETNKEESQWDHEEIKYSQRDNYDYNMVRSAMLGLSNMESEDKALKAIDENTDISFVDKMLELIDEKHLKDSNVYKAAQIDRRLFSKIVSDRTYKPAKDTCIALCLALKLTLQETNDLLSRAGYILSHSSKRDVILEYFFRERIYNLNDVNDVLTRLKQKYLGR